MWTQSLRNAPTLLGFQFEYAFQKPWFAHQEIKTPLLYLKFWHLHLQGGNPQTDSAQQNRMIGTKWCMDWRARSNDSVVDATPGVERWHTLWFMWESPRCPKHLIYFFLFFYYKNYMTIVHCFFKNNFQRCPIRTTFGDFILSLRWPDDDPSNTVFLWVICSSYNSFNVSFNAPCLCLLEPCQVRPQFLCPVHKHAHVYTPLNIPDFPMDVPAALLELLFIWWVIVYGIC